MMRDKFKNRRCCAKARRFLFFIVKRDGGVSTKKTSGKSRRLTGEEDLDIVQSVSKFILEPGATAHSFARATLTRAAVPATGEAVFGAVIDSLLHRFDFGVCLGLGDLAGRYHAA